jgi:tRNA pseudouridine38-40 synthase
MRYSIELSYDGTNFCGWQNQSNGMSIQQTIEDALTTLLKQKIEIVGCGRTDAGVHALQYFAHFNFDKCMPDNIFYSLNALVGKQIAIKNIELAEEDFHARFTAKKRTYQYFMHTQKSPFLENYSYFFTQKADIELMNKAAKNLLGTHDFTSIEKKGSNNKNAICTIFEAYFFEDENGIVFRITANRFLRNMVRACTSTMLMIGTGQLTINEFLSYFENKISIPLKIVVPAKGLFLWEIEY